MLGSGGTGHWGGVHVGRTGLFGVAFDFVVWTHACENVVVCVCGLPRMVVFVVAERALEAQRRNLTQPDVRAMPKLI